MTAIDNYMSAVAQPASLRFRLRDVAATPWAPLGVEINFGRTGGHRGTPLQVHVSSKHRLHRVASESFLQRASDRVSQLSEQLIGFRVSREIVPH